MASVVYYSLDFPYWNAAHKVRLVVAPVQNAQSGSGLFFRQTSYPKIESGIYFINGASAQNLGVHRFSSH
jgi:hypothetical protein